MRAFACLLLAACGARTELGAPDATRDASGAPPDVAVHDGTIRDSPPEAADVMTLPDAGPPGCSDGTREGFVDGVTFPEIAGCGGAFLISGVMPVAPPVAPGCPAVVPNDTEHNACNLHAGNDGLVTSGAGCNVADLCAVGWHVCASADDVNAHSPSGCDGATLPTDPPLFFATRQSSNGCSDCATGTRTAPDCDGKSCTVGCLETAATANDVFGCGNAGAMPPFTGCSPLDVSSGNLCAGLADGWSCSGDDSGFCEAYTIFHAASQGGGVLCCHD